MEVNQAQTVEAARKIKVQRSPLTRMINRAIALGELGRVNLAPLTMSVPILGAFSTNTHLSGFEIAGLALIGLCAHLFGFSLNDLIDMPYDRLVSYRQRDALITQRVSHVEGWFFALLQVPVAIVIYLLLGGRALGLGALCMSIALSVVYNLWSKSGRLARLLSELALAASISLLCLAGASLQPDFPMLTSGLFACELGLVLLLLNSVASGMKDLKTDEAIGARSFVLSTGCRMLDDDLMHVSPLLWMYSVILQVMIWLGGISLLVLFRLGWPLSMLIIGLFIYGALHLRMLLSLKNFSVLRKAMPLLSGFYNYAALALIVSGSFPLWLDLIYGLFVVWLVSIPLRASLRVWRIRQVI
jgi:4-hydroxybenzoate polyprenyltransferase